MENPVSFRFKHVCIESMAVNLPPNEVTSADIEDKLAPIYKKLGIPFGTLEKLSGVKSRYFWDNSVMPSEAATGAAVKAIEAMGFDRSNLGALFNCSVTRDFFEPATACIVHGNLGLPECSTVLDITNACLGFGNGMLLLANLIESGVVKAGILVSGETISRTLEMGMKHILKNENVTRDEFLKLLPMFTLGSGAVAYVLAHDSIATSKHRIEGAVTRSATQHNMLCVGNSDYTYHQKEEFNPIMVTESAKLINAASQLGGRVWKQASQTLGWSSEDVNHIFCHQVGKQVNEGFYKEMGLEYKKEYTIYKKYGNLASAALPTALVLGAQEKNIQPGEKVLLTGFGSGLNSIFTGITW